MVDDRFYASDKAYKAQRWAPTKDPMQGACKEPLNEKLRTAYRSVAEYVPNGTLGKAAEQALKNLKYGRSVLEEVARNDLAREYVGRTLATAMGNPQEMSLLGGYQPPEGLRTSLEFVVEKYVKYAK